MKSGVVIAFCRLFGLVLLLVSWSSALAAGAELRNLVFYQNFSDEEITDLFHDTVFGSEDPTVGRLRAGTVRKHTGPIKYFVAGDRGARLVPLEMMLAGLPQLFPAVPVGAADKLGKANLRIFLLTDRDAMVKKGIEIWGKDLSKDQRLFMKGGPCAVYLDYYGSSSRIRRATVMISLADKNDYAECAFEEFIQALGPINDSRTSKKTLMNDSSFFSRIPLLDLYIANMLYDPAIKPGMTKKQVRKVLPDVLARTKQKLEPLTQTLRKPL